MGNKFPNYQQFHRLILLIPFLFLSGGLYSQDITDEFSLKLWLDARNLEKAFEIDSSIILYEALYEKYPALSNLGFKIAELYFLQRNYDEAMALYKKLYETDPEKNILALYSFGQIAKILGEYRLAERGFDKFLDEFDPGDELRYLKKQAQIAMEGIELAENDSARYKANNALENVSNLHFTQKHLNIYDSERENQISSFAIGCETLNECLKMMPDWLNNPENQSAKFLSAQKFYFSSEKRNGKEIDYVLCECLKENDLWSLCREMPEEINLPGTDNLLPELSIESKYGNPVIYFVSNRDGGRGGYDLWYTLYDSRRDAFKEPKNLGSKVNTSLDEWSPSYDRLSNTLYYSSNGRIGYGGYDVYSSMGELRSWTDPLHAGPVINSSFDDYYLIPDMERVSFMSNRIPDENAYLPYQKDHALVFSLPANLLAKFELEIIKRKVDSGFIELTHRFDSVYYIDSEFDDKIPVFQSVLEEQQSINVETRFGSFNHSLQFNIKPGVHYCFTTDSTFSRQVIEVMATDYTDEIVRKLIIALERNVSLLKHIYYQLDESVLTEKDKDMLDSTIVDVYLKYPESKIRIFSYTDNFGSDHYNLKLSKKRAKLVSQYLISRGIDKDDLEFKGFGKNNPVNSNSLPDGSDNPAGRAMNRRTEIFLDLKTH